MSLTLTTPATVEPITLQQAKEHLRLDTADDDSVVGLNILAAREKAEEITNRALITQTWTWKLDRFPVSSAIALRVPRSPLSSITSIQYVDSDGVTQTWASSNYDVATPGGPRPDRGRIMPAYGEVWPTTREQMDAVTIIFIAGYGGAAEDMPANLVSAMLLHVGTLFEHRENEVIGPNAIELPETSNDIYIRYRTGLD